MPARSPTADLLTITSPANRVRDLVTERSAVYQSAAKRILVLILVPRVRSWNDQSGRILVGVGVEDVAAINPRNSTNETWRTRTLARPWIILWTRRSLQLIEVSIGEEEEIGTVPRASRKKNGK
jgi:hypothetical protein